MRAYVAGAFVEADALDIPRVIAPEPDTEFDPLRVVVRRHRRGRRAVPDATRTQPVHRGRDAGRWLLDVAAVVRGPASYRYRTHDIRRPGIRPATGARGAMPRRTVEGDFDSTDGPSARITRGTADRDGYAELDNSARHQRRDRRRRRRRVAGCRCTYHAGHEASWLYAHVSEEIHGRLLHSDVGRRRPAIVIAVEPP